MNTETDVLEPYFNVIKYIESNLTGEISYEKAASIAGCSTSYFQCMFTYISGISLSEYIRKRRMTQAAFDLQTSQMKVIDVALKYGYDSPTAFHRAFKSVHGITLVAARENHTKLSSFLPFSGYRYAEVADVEVYKEGESSGYSELWLGILS